MSTYYPHTELSALLDKWVEGNRAKDVDAIIQHYSPDVVAFDAVLQLQFQGREAYKAHWLNCMEMCSGPTAFEVRELHQESEATIGFGRFIAYCGGTDAEGNAQGCLMRVTQVYRLLGAEWKIVHEHFSVPFDPETGAAIFDQQPAT